jgi:hypothetical protein
VNDYRRWEDYFWPDAPDVLRNKLGIRDQRMLNFVEAQLSAVRIYEQVIEIEPVPSISRTTAISIDGPSVTFSTGLASPAQCPTAR